MKLILSITSIQCATLAEAAVKDFDENGGSIGRGEDNNWSLPDPKRILSSRHALISFQGGQFYITDTSTNGVFVNHAEQALGKGKTCPIHDGDVLVMGTYEIAVSTHSEQQPTPMTNIEDETPDFFRELTSTASGQSTIPERITLDPEPIFAGMDAGAVFVPELQPPTTIPPPSEPDNLPFEHQYFEPPQAIPEDWDAEFAIASAPESVFSASPEVTTIPVTDVAASALPVVEASTYVREVPRPGRGVRRTLSSSIEDTSPRLNEYLATDRAAVSAADALPSAAATPIDKDLLLAFLDGAGVSGMDVRDKDAAQLMHRLGGVMREMLDGMVRALNERARLKSDFRMAMTMIRPAENNPFKFCASAEEALAVIVSGRGPGYMAPKDAIIESFADITAHQLALMAGMEAAVQTVLQRFDPQELENTFQQSSLIDTLLPAMKKAKCWELFTETYKKISAEAEDRFQELLGDEFGQAYEAHMERLRHNRH